MKHILAAVIILLSVHIAYAGSGIITFENESLDLGNVDTGTAAKADFRFSNTGDGILKILKVKPGWGCTTSTLDKVEYLPGESGVISAVFNTKGRYGINQKSIRVTTDSDTTPMVTLYLRVNAIAEIRPLDTSIHFNKIMENQEYTKKVLIENNMNIPVQIKHIEIDKMNQYKDSFEIDVKTEKNDSMKEYFVFSIKQIKKLKSFNTVSIPVNISTNSTKFPVLRFYIIIYLAKPIEIEPSSLYIYRAQIGNDQIKRISVESNLNSPLEIKKIYSEKYPLTFNIVSESDTIKHIWVGVSEKGTPGNFNDLIRIELKSGNFEKKYTIPVRGNAKLKSQK